MQIGPRLRVGGTLGHIGQQAKLGLGKIEQTAAPALGMIPGIGPLLAAGVAAHGRVLDTSHGSVGLGDIAGAGIKGGAMGALAGGLSHLPGIASHIPGVSSVEGWLGGGAGAGAAGAAGQAAGGAAGGSLNDISNAAVGSIGQAPSAGGGFLSSAARWLTGNGGKNALGLAEGVNAAMMGRKANQLQNRALGTAQQAYAERAPLRQAGMQGMLHPQTPSLTPLADPGNPYAKQIPPMLPQTPGVSPMGR